MVKFLSLPRCLAILVAASVVLPIGSANALTADEYFADGNRLFKDDLYWAALLRYRQAGEEGMSTALLHYNSGVAHYRAGQHVRASEALQKALADPELRVAAHYNLGLNAYALGNSEEALRWFRLARDQNRNEKIQTFAVIAISRIRDAEAVPDEFEERLEERDEKRNFADLDFRLRIGFGTDDNIFRSPADPYVDQSVAAAPVVVPEVQTGAYIPLSLSAKYRVNSLPFEGFYLAYRAAGRYYQDEIQENANEYQHEASFGSEYQREEDSRKREVYSGFKVAQHVETYYDPDDGASREINGINIDDRMNYLRYGPEIALRQSHERLAIGAKFKGQLWNYEETNDVPEFDHEYFYLNLFGQYKFTRTSLLRITAEGYSRRYGDRPAYELDGNQPATNPGIRYDYYALGLTARQRVFGSFWFGVDVKRTERVDQYLGYNNYSRDSFGVEFHWSPGDRFDFEAGGTYHLYDYPNAFAYNNPSAAQKTQESADARVIATFRMTRRLSLFGEARYRETVSNDARIQYERRQYAIGVRWEQ